MKLGSDLCECGDFRSQHYRNGFHSKEACAVCGCNLFRLFAKADAQGLEIWQKYHAGRDALQKETKE